MTLTKSTLAAALATMFIGGLSVNTATAAPKWSDISAVTHSNVSAGTKVVGSDAYSRTDLSAVTHGRSSADEKQVGRYSSDNYSPTDITTITHN
jgi:hypothetical protein